jgi:phage nucleotide-binding protein
MAYGVKKKEPFNALAVMPEQPARERQTKFNIVKAGTAIDRGLSIIIYGIPGAGKTTMASTLPVDQTIIISTEAGLGPLLGTGHHYFDLHFDGDGRGFLNKIEDFHRFLLTEKHPFKYVVLDNISELEQQIINALRQMRKKEFVSILEYGDSAVKMREYFMLYRNLMYKGITVIFNAWEYPFEFESHDGVVKTMTMPKVSKKVSPDICGEADLVGHIEVHQASGKRWVRFVANEQYVAKCQFKGMEENGGLCLPNFPDILEKIYGYDYKENA